VRARAHDARSSRRAGLQYGNWSTPAARLRPNSPSYFTVRTLLPSFIEPVRVNPSEPRFIPARSDKHRSFSSENKMARNWTPRPCKDGRSRIHLGMRIEGFTDGPIEKGYDVRVRKRDSRGGWKLVLDALSLVPGVSKSLVGDGRLARQISFEEIS
jgi:hypothetical protein